MGKKTAKSVYKNLNTKDLITIRKRQLFLDDIRRGNFTLKSRDLEEKGWVWALW